MLIKILPDMHGGYIFIAGGEDFASTIETMVGVGMDGKIIGIKVISHE